VQIIKQYKHQQRAVLRYKYNVFRFTSQNHRIVYDERGLGRSSGQSLSQRSKFKVRYNQYGHGNVSTLLGIL